MSACGSVCACSPASLTTKVAAEPVAAEPVAAEPVAAAGVANAESSASVDCGATAGMGGAEGEAPCSVNAETSGSGARGCCTRAAATLAATGASAVAWGSGFDAALCIRAGVLNPIGAFAPNCR